MRNVNIDKMLENNEIYIVGEKGYGSEVLDVIKKRADELSKKIVITNKPEHYLNIIEQYDFSHRVSKLIAKGIIIVVSTNSPAILLGAAKSAVFYKYYPEDNSFSNKIENAGYTLSTLVTSPLFGLDNCTSQHYEGMFSSDDFVYENIHKVVNSRIKNMPEIPEDELLKIINEEFDKNIPEKIEIDYKAQNEVLIRKYRELEFVARGMIDYKDLNSEYVRLGKVINNMSKAGEKDRARVISRKRFVLNQLMEMGFSDDPFSEE